MNDVARYWEQQAPSFDDAPDHGLRDPAIREAWASLLIGLMPAAPARVADLGCGTGSLAVLLAEAGYDVSGLDVAAGMVTRARAKAAAAGVQADFAIGDAMTPPWPQGSFDVVLARHVLWALPDPGVGLSHWFELLNPEGRLVLVEGRWWTGAGLSAQALLSLMDATGREASIVALDDPALWGGPVSDERYLLTSPPR